MLASDIKDRVEKDCRESREALLETNAAVATTLGGPLKVELLE